MQQEMSKIDHSHKPSQWNCAWKSLAGANLLLASDMRPVNSHYTCEPIR